MSSRPPARAAQLNRGALGGARSLARTSRRFEIRTMAKPKIDYRKLSIPERLDLVEDIWDSIAQDAEALTLSAEERAELDRRWAEHERDPSSAIPWETVRDKLVRRGG